MAEITQQLRLSSAFLLTAPMAKKIEFLTERNVTITGDVVENEGQYGKEWFVPINDGIRDLTMSLWRAQISILARAWGLDTAAWKGKVFGLKSIEMMNDSNKQVKAWVVSPRV